MTRITLDFRFQEIEEDLWILSEYLLLLENGLPLLVEGERRRIRSRVHDPNDEVEESIAQYLEERLESGLTTRYLTASAVTAAWAIYEAGVTSIARHIREKREARLKLNDLRGDFVDRARKYFVDVLRFDLHTSADWEGLSRLAGVRNAFAHANGRVADLNTDSRIKIEQWCKTDSYLRLEDECVIAEAGYAKSAVALVEDLLRDLITRTKASFT
jgi:hypothetical protein